MKKRLIILAALTAIAILAMSGVSMAATTKTNNLQVTASVAALCNIQSVTDIAFGVYDPADASPLDNNGGDITLVCSKGTWYKLFITGDRIMVGALEAENLNFQLWSDSNHTITFPSDNSGSAVKATSKNPIPNTIYARIPAEQDVSVDTYSKTVVASVEY